MKAIVYAAAAFALAGVADAQTTDVEDIVRVDVTEVAGTLAGILGIDQGEVPRSVEVPIEVAADVCEVTAEMLETVRSADQHIECDAAKVSEELTAATREQLSR